MDKSRICLRFLERAIAAVFVFAVVSHLAYAGSFSTVEPTRIAAGTFYNGATLRIGGSAGKDSQIAVRIKGPPEHHVFNRRGKIAGSSGAGSST